MICWTAREKKMVREFTERRTAIRASRDLLSNTTLP